MSRGDYIPPRYAVIAPPDGRHNDRDTPLTRARAGGPGRRGQGCWCGVQAHVLFRTDFDLISPAGRAKLCEGGRLEIAPTWEQPVVDCV